MSGEFKSLVPFTYGAEVTPSDSTVLDPPARGLFIGVGGDVAVRTIKGDEFVIPNHPVGYLLWQVDMVKSTGTTADDIIAGR